MKYYILFTLVTSISKYYYIENIELLFLEFALFISQNMKIDL